MQKRACFGTHEFAENSGICRNCENFEECKKEWEKRKLNRAEF